MVETRKQKLPVRLNEVRSEAAISRAPLSRFAISFSNLGPAQSYIAMLLIPYVNDIVWPKLGPLVVVERLVVYAVAIRSRRGRQRVVRQYFELGGLNTQPVGRRLPVFRLQHLHGCVKSHQHLVNDTEHELGGLHTRFLVWL